MLRRYEPNLRKRQYCTWKTKNLPNYVHSSHSDIGGFNIDIYCQFWCKMTTLVNDSGLCSQGTAPETYTSGTSALKRHISIPMDTRRARHLFFPQLGRRTTIKQHGLVRYRNLLGHNDNILFFCICNEKKKIGENFDHLYVYFFFQDCCLWSTLTHHKSFVFFPRGSVVYPCPFWRQREQDYIQRIKKCMEIKKKIFRTLKKLECTRHTHVISFHWCMFTENYYFNKK